MSVDTSDFLTGHRIVLVTTTVLTHFILTGVGLFLKSKNPKIKVVLADPQVRSP